MYADAMTLVTCRAERGEFASLPEEQALALAALLSHVSAFAEFLRECARSDAHDVTTVIELTTPEPDMGAAEIVRLAGAVVPGLQNRRIAGNRKLADDLAACKKREYAAIDAVFADANN